MISLGHPESDVLIYPCRHNTTVAVNTLESIVHEVRTKHAITMSILQVINPVADQLLNSKRDSSFEVEAITAQLFSASSTQSIAGGKN